MKKTKAHSRSALAQAWKLFNKNLTFIVKYCFIAGSIFLLFSNILIQLPPQIGNATFYGMVALFCILLAVTAIYSSYKNLIDYQKQGWKAGLKLWFVWIIFAVVTIILFFLRHNYGHGSHSQKMNEIYDQVLIYFIGLNFILGFFQFLGGVLVSWRYRKKELKEIS